MMNKGFSLIYHPKDPLGWVWALFCETLLIPSSAAPVTSAIICLINEKPEASLQELMLSHLIYSVWSFLDFRHYTHRKGMDFKSECKHTFITETDFLRLHFFAMQDGWGTLIPFIFPLCLLSLVKQFVITTQEWIINRSLVKARD